MEKTIDLHQDDWPGIQYNIDIIQAARKLKDEDDKRKARKASELEAKYEKQRAAKADRLQADRLYKTRENEKQRTAKAARIHSDGLRKIREKEKAKEYRRRARFDLRNKINSIDRTIDGNINPDYVPLG